MKISEQIKKIGDSPTLAITQKAKEMKIQGIDVVTFGAGEPDFDTPEIVRNAAKEALDKGFTHYTPVAGIPELKNAIAGYIERNTGIKYPPEQIIVTCGAKAAIFMALQVLLNPGDEVIVPAPYWVSYPDQVKLANAVPVMIAAKEENLFKITPRELEAATTSKTRAIIINSPSNPSGAVYTKDELRSIVNFCAEKDIAIISDEIYEKLVYEGEFCSTISAHKDASLNTVYINGLSKSFAMTGWRIGYAAGPVEIIKAMSKYQGQLYTHITSFVQKAAVTALNAPVETVNVMKQKFKSRRDLIVSLANDIPGFSCVKPAGAFYIFANITQLIGRELRGKKIETSSDFATFLLEEAHVAVVPGTAFGMDGYIRFSFATSEEEIKKGFKRIKELLNGQR